MPVAGINWDQWVGDILRREDVSCALALAEQVCPQGEQYLVGGAVYRNLAWHAYRAPRVPCDVDVLVRRIEYPLCVPRGWMVEFHEYGVRHASGPYEVRESETVPRFLQGEVSVDIISLETLCGRDAALKDYFACVPLSVQAMAIDVESRKVWGSVGVSALEYRRVWVNNRKEAIVRAGRRHVTLEQFVEERARSLGFAATV